ncbi:MAG: DUF305 domain-containing protein [Gordonia sp. (in: high G+C Gram-positive bacteria)]|uniref:DUF305 domain-containing protein n=1 Tax=Gordonia sp. (in: high G+C Gram-positive bacteria) TaxID=84139 RepID=UPI003BB561C6
MTESSSRLRPAVTVLAVATLAAIALIGGIMVRPLVIDDSRDQQPTLSAVEVAFLQDMTAHHQQATEMGKLIDRDGIDPAVRNLGRQIATSQQFELGTMSGWLRLVGEPLNNPVPMAWMTRYAGTGQDDHHASAVLTDDAAHQMPGMSTPDEVAALGSLPPTEAENRFLIQMQRHHYGGIAMAQDLTARVPDGIVAQLAASMISNQSKETGLMGTMLVARGVEP